MEHGAWERVPIEAQSVDAPLSRAAVFLVMAAGADDDAIGDVLGTVGDLVKHVGFRDLNGRLSCVVGIGAALWDVIGDAARVIDETVGFRYFDARDLLGFADGTANPTGPELPETALIGADPDPDFAGGSYVVVQKYLHDMTGWARLSAEQEEAIMGRTKLDNIELDDDDAPRKSHKTLATIEDDAGGELAILRDNMPFGRPGAGEFGTYFIGTTFFVPTAAMLDELAEPPSDEGPAAARDDSLGIGSLRPKVGLD